MPCILNQKRNQVFLYTRPTHRTLRDRQRHEQTRHLPIRTIENELKKICHICKLKWITLMFFAQQYEQEQSYVFPHLVVPSRYHTLYKISVTTIRNGYR